MNNFSVAAVFSNHMVLQRNKIISIFGYADDKVCVKVTLLDSNKNILAYNCADSAGGRWEVRLAPQAAQQDCEVIVEGPEKIVFNDVAIGEVWLAGGQSNMEFELHNCTEASEAMSAPSSNVRFYYTNKIGWKDDHFYEAERNTCWQTWDSPNKAAWSAVGYFFAEKLSKDLDCIVGVIGCNWGGTSASAWMRKEYLEKDDELRTYLIEQEEATKGKTIEQQIKEYNDYTIANDEWQKKCNDLYATVPGITWNEIQERLGPCLWPGPKACNNPYRPTGLYDCMLSRILPYTLKGVIWYQGESDDHKPGMYAKLFSNMIDNWRTDWNDSQLPFVFVQLTVNRYEQDKDFKHWCLVREAQEKVHNTVKNAYMVPTMDLGAFNDIHPKAKREVGERLEASAMNNVYGIPTPKGKVPVLESAISNPPSEDGKNGSITLSITNAEDGFVHKVDEEVLNNYKNVEQSQGTPLPEDFTGFEIAGSDEVYYPAKFAFGGTEGKLNQIILCSNKVTTPVYARYCWYNYGPVTVFSKNGLPVAPFRACTAPSVYNHNKQSDTKTEHAEIQQIMTV